MAYLGATCQIPKLTEVGEKARLLAWFGSAHTGETIPVGPDGEPIPEVVVVDAQQLQRAILDPFGYLQSGSWESARATGAVPCNWSLVKQLYR